MIEFSKKYSKIFLTSLMLVLLLVSTVVYILNYESYYKQKLKFNETTFDKIHLISEEIAQNFDVEVLELVVVGSNQIEINPDSSISSLSINFYVNKTKKEYQITSMSHDYYVTYIGNYESDESTKILLVDYLESIKHIEIDGTKTRLLMSNELVRNIRQSNQEQYLVDNKGKQLITSDLVGAFIKIRRIQLMDEMWKVNEGIDFFLSIYN